jgi:cyclopentanol dehydrogenase
MGDLDGRTAIVTGGARGVGGASAAAISKAGARVVIADHDIDAARELAKELTDDGGDAIAIALDVRQEDSWHQAVDEVQSQFGSVDILVNNAGVSSSRDENGVTIRLHVLPVAEWNRVFDVNVRGVYLGIRTVVPLMRRGGRGSIINISSIGGIVGSRVSAYGSSKGAVRSMTKAAAVNLARENIRVNSIHPGVVRTDMTRALLGTDQGRAGTLARYPMGRIAEPPEIAEGVAFLASDRSSFMTGAEVVIDGGLTAW